MIAANPSREVPVRRSISPLPVFLLLALVPTRAAAGEDPSPPPPVSPLPGIRTLRLSLRESVALALRNNLDLRVAAFAPSLAAASVAEADALYDHVFTAHIDGGASKTATGDRFRSATGEFSQDSFGAGAGIRRLLPTGGTLSLDTAVDRTLTNSAFSFVNPARDSSLGLNLRQPLLRGFGREYTESGIRLATDAKDRADLELRAATEDLVRRVETLYWDLVRARGDAEAERKGFAVAEDLQRVNEARLAAGAGTKVEVSQAAAGVAARRVDVLRAENEARSAEENLLGLLVPRSPETPTGERLRLEPAEDPAADLPPVPLEEIDAAVERALLRRSDIRARRVAADEAQVEVVRAESEAETRLDLAVGLSYGGLDGNLGGAWSNSMASRDHSVWTVGLVLEIPIGNRAARARLQRAHLGRGRAEAEIRALESDAAVRVRNARRDLESAREQIDAAARATALAEEQLEAEKDRLRNDKSTTFQVLRLEGDLTDSRRTEIRAQTAYRAALTRYDFECGGILEARGLEKK